MARRPAYTLIELLVALAVVLLVAALLVGATQRVREAAARARCLNNLHQLGAAAQNYHHRYGRLPPAVLVRGSDPETATDYRKNFGPNWAVYLLGDVEQETLYRRAAASAAAYPKTGDAGWRAVRSARVPVYLCPSDPANATPFADDWARGNYGINAGPGVWTAHPGEGSLGVRDGQVVEHVPTFADPVVAGVHTYPGLPYPGGGATHVNRGRRLAEIPDGAATTILFAELRAGPDPTDPRGVWAMGQVGSSVLAGAGRVDTPTPNFSCSGCDDVLHASDRPDLGMGNFSTTAGSYQVTAKSLHPGGVDVGMCDGSARFVRDGVSPRTWFLLHNRSDRQAVGVDW